jgi:hypothetical protein
MSNFFVIPQDAVPLVRNEPWERFVIFWTDSAKTIAEDLTDKEVTAQIRWSSGEQDVTVVVDDDPTIGFVTFSLTAEQTEAMPLGELSILYMAIDDTTWGSTGVDVLEGIIP